jgi:hypothetical protein
VLVVKFDEDKIIIHDQDHSETITSEEYIKYKNNKKYLLIYCKDNENAFEKLEQYKERATNLKEVTKGRINFYKSPYASKIGFDIFRQMTKSIKEPEELQYYESVALDTAFRGGLRYDKKGSYKKCFDNDMNSMYNNYMMSSNFLFPVTQPTTKMFTHEEFDKLDFYPIGLFLVKLTETEDTIKYFNKDWCKKASWFTHYDLTMAKLCKVKIEIVENKTNALMYGSSNCLRGNKVFTSFVTYFDDLKQQGFEVKDISTSLWGYLSSHNITRERITKQNKEIDISDYHIEEYDYINDTAIVKLQDRVNIFKYPWARCSIFLTAYCRLQMMKILMTIDEEIVCVNTDGFITTKKVKNISFSSKIGDFKVKHQGDCDVHHSNNVEWH